MEHRMSTHAHGAAPPARGVYLDDNSPHAVQAFHEYEALTDKAVVDILGMRMTELVSLAVALAASSHDDARAHVATACAAGVCDGDIADTVLATAGLHCGASVVYGRLAYKFLALGKGNGNGAEPQETGIDVRGDRARMVDLRRSAAEPFRGLTEFMDSLHDEERMTLTAKSTSRSPPSYGSPTTASTASTPIPTLCSTRVPHAKNSRLSCTLSATVRARGVLTKPWTCSGRPTGPMRRPWCRSTSSSALYGLRDRSSPAQSHSEPGERVRSTIVRLEFSDEPCSPAFCVGETVSRRGRTTVRCVRPEHRRCTRPGRLRFEERSRRGRRRRSVGPTRRGTRKPAASSSCPAEVPAASSTTIWIRSCRPCLSHASPQRSDPGSP